MGDIGQLLVEQQNGVLVMSLRGEHDVSNVGTLELELAAATTSTAKVVVDLSEASFIDSSVVSTIITTARTDSTGRVVAVAAPPGTPPRRLADLVSLSEIVPVFDSRDAAITYAQNGTQAT